MNEVIIQQECDGFHIVVYGETGEAVLNVSISQEETVERLTEVFDHFNIKSSYEESY